MEPTRRDLLWMAAAGLGTALTPGWALAEDAPVFEVPPGHEANRAEEPPLPGAEASHERARLFVQALREGKPEVALPFFFPREVFAHLKAIKDPDRYHQRLVKVYDEDILELRKGLRDPDNVSFVGFRLGRQKRWMARGKEGNAYPYWANYKAQITVKDGDKERDLPMRVMINWGEQWYVTHLTRK